MREKVTRRYVPLSSLVAHPNNYKQHPQEQVNDLKASLIRFGQVRPVIAQTCAGSDDYLLVAGHGITLAAQQLVEDDPTRYAHLNEWDVVVLPSSWSDTDIKGYMVADNETGGKAMNDEELLAALLQEQVDAGYDLMSVGSDEDTLHDLLAKMTPPTLDELTEQYGDEPEEDAFWPVIKVKVSPETKEVYDSLMEQAEGSDDNEKLAWLLERVNVAVEDVDE